MKGCNEIHMNHATVMEALQEYLDKRMGEYAPRVASIRSNQDTIIVSTSSEDKQEGE